MIYLVLSIRVSYYKLLTFNSTILTSLKLLSQVVIRKALDNILRTQCAVCSHCVRRRSQTVWRHLGNTLEIYDYLLQHGAHVDIANATRHKAHYGKTRRCAKPQNQKYITYSIHCRQRRTKPRPWITRRPTESFVKFGCVVFEIYASGKTDSQTDI